jgi:hypothetical protein
VGIVCPNPKGIWTGFFEGEFLKLDMYYGIPSVNEDRVNEIQAG